MLARRNLTLDIDTCGNQFPLPPKSIISPKIVINKKNYVFKEAIDQLRRDKQTSKMSLANDESENSQCSSDTHFQLTMKNIKNTEEQLTSTFNPFELAGGRETKNSNVFASANKGTVKVIYSKLIM